MGGIFNNNEKRLRCTYNLSSTKTRKEQTKNKATCARTNNIPSLPIHQSSNHHQSSSPLNHTRNLHHSLTIVTHTQRNSFPSRSVSHHLISLSSTRKYPQNRDQTNTPSPLLQQTNQNPAVHSQNTAPLQVLETRLEVRIFCGKRG